LESHQKAAAAGFGSSSLGEIVKVEMGENSFGQDERVRCRVSLDNFKILPPAFVANGTVTAGNASVPSDGAAVVLLASKGFANEQKIKPFGKILGYASVAGEPELTFTAAVDAVKASLKICGLKLKDIDLFEICEAFAAQAIYTRDTLKIPVKKMNICGGDLALGHPLGAAGSRIVVTLAHALKTQNKKYGLAAVCYGGGGGMAVIIERAS